MVIFSEISSTGAPRLSLDLRACPRVRPDARYITYGQLSLVEKTSLTPCLANGQWSRPYNRSNTYNSLKKNLIQVAFTVDASGARILSPATLMGPLSGVFCHEHVGKRQISTDRPNASTDN
jgi:hypothetical protein